MKKRNNIRKRIYEIIEVAEKENDKLSKFYDVLMISLILLSIVPLTMKNPSNTWMYIEQICVIFFIIDYILRICTADYKYESSNIISFIKYPFSFMAIVDLLSILPSFIPINGSFRLLRLLRMSRALRVLRVFKTLRYSKNFNMIIRVIKKSKDSLIAVGALVIAYIFVAALIMFNVEPESFNTFYDAIYFATISLTSVGYGDIYPITSIGRTIIMISSIFGIAVIALPAGIITAGFMNELNKNNIDNEKINI